MKRIEGIVFAVNKTRVFADIGCDHGYISKAVLENISGIERVFALDISEKCLLKAKKLLEHRQNVVFFKGDGLNPIKNHLDEIDCIAICGMGAHTICSILSQFKIKARLVLQPQGHAEILRKFVANQGYNIKNDFVTYEKGKFYDIIACEPSDDLCEYTNEQLLFGVYYKQKNETLKLRLTKQKDKYLSLVKTQKNSEYLEKLDLALQFQD